MSNRSLTFIKIKQVLGQHPVSHAEEALTRVLPKVSPSAVLPPYPHTDFMPLSGPAPQSLDATRVLPVVETQQPADLDVTQVLPPVSEMLPPSAAHVDPAAWHDRTHVEDNDLVPESRGRHVLDELKAVDAEAGMPDLVGRDEPAPVVRGAYSRIVAALEPTRPATLANAVRIARQAYKTSKGNRHWFVEQESRLDACWRRIEQFNADWDRQLRAWNAAVCGQEAVIAGYSLAAAYEENRQRIAEANARRIAEGQPPLDATATSFTRGMAAELQQLIVRRATAGSAVSQ